jgi:SprB repeat
MKSIYTRWVRPTLLSFVCIAVGYANLLSQTLVINEISNGASGNKEFIELVVSGTCGQTLDIRGYIVDDNCSTTAGVGTTAGYGRFMNVPQWAAVPTGTIIVLYNGADVNEAITGPDITDSNCDGVYFIPLTTGVPNGVFETNSTALADCTPASYLAITSFPAVNWNPIAYGNTADLGQVRDAAGNQIMSVGYGTGIAAPGGGTFISFTGTGGNRAFQHIGANPLLQANWANNAATPVSTTSQSPGFPNSCANAAWIQGMRPVDGLSSLIATWCDFTYPVSSNTCNDFTYTFNNTCVADSYTWASSNPGVATITPGGTPVGQTALLDPLSNGTTTLTVTATKTFTGLFAGPNTPSASCVATPKTVTQTQEVNVSGCSACPNISASVSGNGTFCAESNTEDFTNPLAVTITGGAANYTVVLTDGTSNYTRTNYVSGTPIGIGLLTTTTFTLVSVTDNNGCTASTLTGSAVFTQSPDNITIAEVLTQPTCENQTGGAIDITPSGGLTPYTYLWSNAATTQDLTGLAAGTYTVTVTGLGGCEAVEFYELVPPTGCSTNICATVTIAVNSTPTCGGSNGSLTANPVGGTGPYTYSWSNGATTQTIIGLASNTYTVIVTHPSCNTTVGSSVFLPNDNTNCCPTSVNISSSNPTCGFSNGSITATPVGGTGPFSYAWSNSASTATISNLPAGTFTVQITSAACLSASGTAASSTTTLISDNTNCCPTSVNISSTNPTCGLSNGSITATPVGGTGPFSYAWSNSATTATISNLPAGTFTVQITSAACLSASGTAASSTTTLINDNSNCCTLTCPAATSVSCTSAVPAPAPASVTTSLCTGGSVFFVSDMISNQTCPNRYTITRRYAYAATQSSAANSTNTCTQVITVNDLIPPTFNESLPANTSIACTDPLPIAPMLTGSDNCAGGVVPDVIWINEFHYDNSAVNDAGEFIEVAGTAGINLSDYRLILYNGNGGVTYNTLTLSGTIDNEGGSGFGAVSFPYSATNGAIQNGAPDGIALYRISTNQVIQFLSYEGVFQATNGPAMGTFSVDVGVSETNSTVPGSSIHLTGSGSTLSAFTWSTTTTNSAGTLNVGQTITSLPISIAAAFMQTEAPGACAGSRIVTRTWTITDACGNSASHQQVLNVGDTDVPVLTPAPANITLTCTDAIPPVPNVIATDRCDPAGIINGPVWINEIHYDNVGGDAGEFIEIAGRAGTNLAGYDLFFYNGATSMMGGTYDNEPLSGVIPDQSNGFGTLAFFIPGIQNGPSDAIALVQGGTVLQFLSYEGSMTAIGGPANGMVSTDIGVLEPGNDPDGLSLRLTGNGIAYASFVWNNPDVAAPATPGLLNQGQTIPAGQAPVGLPVLFSTTTTPPSPTCPYNRTITRTWRATDACGNTATHTQTITIQDVTPPTVTCQPLTVSLSNAGTVSITQTNITFTATDGCTPNSSLVVLPSSATYTCADDGETRTFVVSVRDECGNIGTCNAQVTINPFPRCEPRILVTDPCICKNNATTTTNGQFGEKIKIESLTGFTWTVTSVSGLFAANSPNPPASPIPVTVGTQFVEMSAGSGDYFLEGVHIDDLGYSITVSNGTTSLTIGNNCRYPAAEVTSNLNGPFCLYSDAVPLVGIPGDANFISAGFTINGTPATVFDPGALGIGNYVVVYTVNGGTPDQFSATDPGCIQTITFNLQVVETPASLSCNNLVQISLDADCQVVVHPDMVLEGTYLCFDDYEVTITGLNGSPNYGNVLTGANIGQTLKATVRHLVSGNTCWGNIIVEDKLPPVIDCEDIVVPCALANLDPLYLQNTLNIADAYPSVEENCTNFISTFDTGILTAQPCEADYAGFYVRNWTVTDASGNSSTCIQTIYLERFSMADVDYPEDVTINCSAANASTSPSVTGAPYVLWPVTGANPIRFNITPENGGVCSIQSTYVDQLIPVCDGTSKILRTWTVVNWCEALTPFPPSTNPQYYVQLIKIVDENRPVFSCPPNTTVGTNSANCCATTDLQDVIVSDACSRINSASAKINIIDPVTDEVISVVEMSGSVTSFPGNNLWTPDTLAAFGTTPCLPLGRHIVTYLVKDDCGNTSTCSYAVRVQDQTPPYPICHEWTQVAIGADGQIEVPAASLDNGSYDNCSPVAFKARRMNNNSCQSNGSFQDEVRFCCSDVGSTVMVTLRIYDIDPGTGSVQPTSFEGSYNDCMVQVLVEDKLRPSCAAPSNITVTCEEFDPTLSMYGTATFDDNCCLGPVQAPTADYSRFDTVCNRGTITRTFRRSDCHGNGPVVCTQRIIVNYVQDYFVRFPNDVIVTTCNATGNYGQPTFFGEDCELLGVSYTDDIFTVVPDACFKIERTWNVLNWCTYNPNAGLISVPNPNPNATTNSTANLPGPIVSEPGTLAPWAPSSIALTPGAPAFNFGTLWNANANGYTYKQIIKVIDTQAPTVNCPTSPVEFCDVTDNNDQLWNASFWWDALIGSHDLCEGDVDLTINTTDACSGANVSVRFLLFLDLDGDGTQESVVNSTTLGIAGLGWNAVPYNNVSGAGVIRQFDGRPVPANQKYGFALQQTVSGTTRTASVRWNTQQNMNSYVVPQLPYGKHKIKWFINDGCGNEKECVYEFIVKDCKAPIVVCINGLSSNIGPTGVCPTLWVTDFLLYAYDNCTPEPLLKYGIRKSGTGTGFPYAAGSTTEGNQEVSYGCQDLPAGATSDLEFVEVWAIDRAGNASFCETFVKIQDNSNVCGNGTNASVAGVLKTEEVEGVEASTVSLQGAVGLGTVTSDVQGAYMFSNALPIGANSTVTALNNQDPKNGVTTYDLLQISRHILGLEPLNTPYKMIAADANKSNTITSFDIVELRKLVLGVYSELPNNTSWRFVDKSQQFANPQNPFAETIREDITIAQIQANQFAQDFVGVKVGDVNGSAQANGLMAADDRSAGTLMFDVNDQTVVAGQEVVVNFKAADKQLGYQFTMNLNGLEVEEIIPGANLTEENFAVFADALTTSAYGASEFSVKFRATKGGKLSEMIGASSRLTRAVAYNEAGENLEIAFRFNNGGVSTVTGVGFELYQNSPNPFVSKTFIGFHLPESASAVLTVMDETGRVVYTQEGDFAKGYNAIALDRSQVGVSGMLYYKLETATHTATRKMIQTK